MGWNAQEEAAGGLAGGQATPCAAPGVKARWTHLRGPGGRGQGRKGAAGRPGGRTRQRRPWRCQRHLRETGVKNETEGQGPGERIEYVGGTCVSRNQLPAPNAAVPSSHAKLAAASATARPPSSACLLRASTCTQRAANSNQQQHKPRKQDAAARSGLRPQRHHARCRRQVLLEVLAGAPPLADQGQQLAAGQAGGRELGTLLRMGSTGSRCGWLPQGQCRQARRSRGQPGRGSALTSCRRAPATPAPECPRCPA